jgi:hypothetical protein
MLSSSIPYPRSSNPGRFAWAGAIVAAVLLQGDLALAGVPLVGGGAGPGAAGGARLRRPSPTA